MLWDRLQQIERRMDERRQTGNVLRSDGASTILPQGMAFVTWARRIGWLFGVDSVGLIADTSAVRWAADVHGKGAAQ